MEKKKAKKFSTPVRTKEKLKESKKMSKNKVYEVEEVIEKPKSEKERLLELYDELKALNVRSISDLENLIARAE